MNSRNNKMRDLMEKMLYGLLLLVYYPLYWMLILAVNKEIVSRRIGKLFGTQRESQIGEFGGENNKYLDVSAVGPDEEIDFLTNRAPGYVERITLWTARELAKLFAGNQRVELISDGQLRYCLHSTVFALSLRHHPRLGMYGLSLRELDDLRFYPRFNFCARYVWFDEERIIIEMDDGIQYESDDPNCADQYKLAKLHLQVCLTFYAPGLAHNYVHFGIPGTMSVLIKRHLAPDTSVLHHLLAPHLRFTERINFQALHVGKATSNRRSRFQKVFFPRQYFPLRSEHFVDQIARKCRTVHRESFVARHQENKGKGTKEDTCRGYRPHFINDPALMKVPYLYFLAQYYDVIRSFVTSLAPHIDRKEWEQIANEMSSHVEGYDVINMTDALTNLIFQCAVVHDCDHQTFTRYFAARYGCMTLRHRFAPCDDVRRDPSLLLTARDVMETRCFQNIFVDFIRSESCRIGLKETRYGFESLAARHCADKFIRDLKRLDERLKTETPQLGAGSDGREEVRAINLQLIPLDEINNTICY